MNQKAVSRAPPASSSTHSRAPELFVTALFRRTMIPATRQPDSPTASKYQHVAPRLALYHFLGVTASLTASPNRPMNRCSVDNE